MAKNKNTAPASTDAAAPASRVGENPAFKRIASVTLPTLKTQDGKPVYIKVLAAMVEKQTPKKNEDGTTRMGVITTMNVVNLETGELCCLVPGKALEQNLRDYKGGNQAYVGLCFEVCKYAKAEGKSWKAWSIHEIEAPGEGKV